MTSLSFCRDRCVWSPSILLDLCFLYRVTHHERLYPLAYEVITPSLKPSEQMQLMESLDIDIVKYIIENVVSNESLSTILKE